MEDFTRWAVNMSGNNFEIHCVKHTTVLSLKQKTGVMAGIDWVGIRLLIREEELESQWTVDGERIKQDAQMTFLYDDDQPPPLVDSFSDEDVPHLPPGGSFESGSDSDTS